MVDIVGFHGSSVRPRGTSITTKSVTEILDTTSRTDHFKVAHCDAGKIPSSSADAGMTKHVCATKSNTRL